MSPGGCRAALRALCCRAAAAGVLLAAASANAYPERPITFIVPAPPGGGADAIARAFGEQLTRRLGQPVLVHNVPGASGAIAARQVLRAAPDGYTLLVGVTSNLITTPLINSSAGYAHTSFTPVAKLGGTPMALATGVRSALQPLPRLLEQARQAPHSLSVAIGGSTDLGTLTVAALMEAAHVDLLAVPYQGAAPALTALLAGQVDLAVLPFSAMLAQWRAGRIAIVAVLSAQRYPLAADVPTLAEAGLPAAADVEISALLVGPPGLDANVVETLNRAVQSTLTDNRFRAGRLAQGEFPGPPMSPGEVAAFLQGEHERYRALLPQAATTRQERTQSPAH
jgi:tripartite-type tricarboxylate transporter receptor subunit TctC